MSPTLPGFCLVFLLAIACSRRVPALRPVVAAFAAWAILDAATGPLWLRAGVCVAWPGVAVVAAVWGLKDEGPGSEPPSPHPALTLPETDATANGHRSTLRAVILPALVAVVYINAGIASASYYRLGDPTLYHLALPLSRLSTLPFAAHALLSRPWSRPWATRAAVTPLLGLACGVVLGVWTLLPAGLESVREQWGRLAGAETLVTMGAVGVCCVGAWWEARRGTS